MSPYVLNSFHSSQNVMLCSYLNLQFSYSPSFHYQSPSLGSRVPVCLLGALWFRECWPEIQKSRLSKTWSENSLKFSSFLILLPFLLLFFFFHSIKIHLWNEHRKFFHSIRKVWRLMTSCYDFCRGPWSDLWEGNGQIKTLQKVPLTLSSVKTRVSGGPGTPVRLFPSLMGPSQSLGYSEPY